MIDYKLRTFRLEGVLEEIADWIDEKGYADVVDGDYGIPAPNDAMKIRMLIDEALGLRP
jgi:hypothetical protein